MNYMFLRSIGSKRKFAKDIVEKFPSHDVYLEPFFRTGSIYFTKKKCVHNFLNDIDDEVFNLWNVYTHNYKELLEKIADDEMKHYSFWKEYTNKDVKPYYFKLFWYGYIMPFVSKKLALRFMKRLENYAHLEYTANLLNEVEGQWIINDESLHEKMLNQVLENDYLSKTVEE